MKGHIRQRGKQSWEIKYDIGRDPVTGRRITKTATIHGAKRDAQRELRRLLKTVDDGIHTDPGKLTVADWLNQWLDEAISTVSLKTHERYAEIVKKHLIPNLGTLSLGKLQPIHIQKYYNKALASGRCDGRGGLAPQTVLHFDRVLNVALKRACSLQLIPRNPVDHVKRPKVERREMRVMEPDESATLLRTANGTRLHTPIFLVLATGLRRSELMALRWSQDIDLGKRTLTVNQSLEQTKEGLRFKEPKTKRSRRTIALSPSVVEVLQAHKVNQLKERMALGLGRNQSGLVFTQLGGTPLDPRNFTHAFTRLVERAGIPRITLHGLRHTHLTNLLREGIHPKIACERAGHASIATTMDIYSHVTPGMQEEAAMQIDAALRTVLEQK